MMTTTRSGIESRGFRTSDRSIVARQVLSALALLGALVLPCAAQDSAASGSQESPWNGAWQADPDSLHFDGPTFSIATDAEGYTVTMGGKPGPKVVCDGRPHTAENGNTTTCNKTGKGYELETTKDGKTVSKQTTTVSNNGKTFTRKMEYFPPGSSPVTMTFPSQRVGEGKGIAGTWRVTAVVESSETGMMTIRIVGDSIVFKETDQAKPVVCKLDGTPTAMSGTQTVSIKMEGPHTLKVVYASNGKVRRENTFALSLDGNTISETDFTPDPSPSTTTMVLHRM
jgi:hypothetical protein